MIRFLVALFLMVTGAAADQIRIKDLVEFDGVRANDLVGYGLVVGLNGTGDTLNNIPFTKQSLQAMLERMGVNIRGSTIRTGNVAAVMVTGNLPAFGTQGTRMDVTVSALGDAKNLTGNVVTRDIVQAAKAWVPQMKEEGADIVIALSHSGIDIKPGEMMENASFHLAGVDGIDAVFTGHQHLVFPGPKDFVGLEGVDAEKGLLNGKPAVMGGLGTATCCFSDIAYSAGWSSAPTTTPCAHR